MIEEYYYYVADVFLGEGTPFPEALRAEPGRRLRMRFILRQALSGGVWDRACPHWGKPMFSYDRARTILSNCVSLLFCLNQASNLRRSAGITNHCVGFPTHIISLAGHPAAEHAFHVLEAMKCSSHMRDASLNRSRLGNRFNTGCCAMSSSAVSFEFIIHLPMKSAGFPLNGETPTRSPHELTPTIGSQDRLVFE